MALSAADLYFIAWFRSLRPYDQMVIYGWLLTGDPRLLASLWGRLIHRQQDELFEVATPEGG